MQTGRNISKGQKMKAAVSSSSSFSSSYSSICSHCSLQKTQCTGNDQILTSHHSVQHSVTAVNKKRSILRYNPLPAILTSLCQVTQPYGMKNFHVQTAVFMFQ
jgi:hypothetical protein